MSKAPTKRATAVQQSAESILTRYKSAQQGRQLRKKDRSMKSITQLLKSASQRTTSAGQLQKKTGKEKNATVKKSPRKSSSRKVASTPADVGAAHSEQSPTSALKKKPVTDKKITLKPKYEMKVIARTNKRKLNTPSRAGVISSPTHTKTEVDRSRSNKEYGKFGENANFSSELTMADVVRLAEETDCLDDEDLMEILTCPSPVWWEDPPDDEYVEDPIFMRIPTNRDNEDNCIQNKNTETTGKTKGNSDIVVKINDARLMEKRKKLEKILGNIKSKFDAYKNNEVHSVSDTMKESNKTDGKIIDTDANNELNTVTINSEGNEYDVFLSDISINGEELLKELENMDIPIVDDIKTINNNSDNKQSNENNIVKMKLIDKRKIRNETTINGTDREMPKKVPRLNNIPIEKSNTESPKSSISTSGDAASSEIDSISDTNIQYLDEDENEVDRRDLEKTPVKDDTVKETEIFVGEDKKKLVTVSTDTESMTDFESYVDNSDFITVYKIMSQKYTDTEDNGAREDDNGFRKSKENKQFVKSKAKGNNDTRLNLFFKKRKNTGTNMKRVGKMQKNDANNSECDNCKRKSFIPIPDSNKRLCLRCSSIYEHYCTFCATVIDGKCNCEVAEQSPKTLYSCNECEFCANTLVEARKHLKSYHSQVERCSWTKCFTLS